MRAETASCDSSYTCTDCHARTYHSAYIHAGTDTGANCHARTYHTAYIHAGTDTGTDCHAGT